MTDATMSDSELLRYSRQIMLPDFDIAGQEKLLAAKVLIVGVGGWARRLRCISRRRVSANCGCAITIPSIAAICSVRLRTAKPISAD